MSYTEKRSRSRGRHILGVAWRCLAVFTLAAGPGAPAAGQTAMPGDAVIPYRISVPDSVLNDLKARLTRTRFPDQLQNVGWDYGTDPAYLRSLVEYWRDR